MSVDNFSRAVGDRCGAEFVGATSLLGAPAVRARELVRLLIEEGPTSKVETPAEKVHRLVSAHELSAQQLATRDVSRGVLCLFELHGRFSAPDLLENTYRALLVWDAAGWQLFELAAVAD